MKSWIFAVMATSMVCCGISRGTVSIVKNGSFENDGLEDYLAPGQSPEYWCDVSYDPSKFSMYIWNDWATHGNYSLTMYTQRVWTFEPNDAAIVTQSVYLAGANKIIFDLSLGTFSGSPWDVNVVTASVLIDGVEIWNSDGLEFTEGQFIGHIETDINEALIDENPHILTLRILTDVSNLQSIEYYAQWDFVRFDTLCDSSGPQPADFDENGIVDIYDLNVLADGWLTTSPDLTGDGLNDFLDFASLAGVWMSTSEAEIPCDAFFLEPDFVFLDADLNDDGIVDYYDIYAISSEWLYNGGLCVRTDLNGDGFVDFIDYAELVNSWQQSGDLYGL